MAGNNSLLNYNKKQSPFTGSGNVSNNFNRNHAATQKPMDGWRGGTDYNNVWSYAQKVNWNQNYTRDPLANFGSSKSSGASFATILSGIMMGLTGVTAALGLFGTLKELFGKKNSSKNPGYNDNFSNKQNKEINKNTENAQDISTALDSSIKTAQNIGDNASKDTITETNNNLMEAIQLAQQQKNDAANKAATAKANIDTLNADKTKEENVKNGLLNDKSNLGKTLTTLKNTDTSNMTDEQKSEHKAKIAKLEKDIKNIEKKIEDSQKKIDAIDEKIKVQAEIKRQNDNTANSLDTKITNANKLVEQLNKKTKDK